MSRSIDLYSYDKLKLIQELCKFCKTQDTETVCKILDDFGSTIADRYILLNNEFWEDYNCYCQVARVFDFAFNVDDTFSVFCPIFGDVVDYKNLKKAQNADEWLKKNTRCIFAWEKTD